MIGASPAWARVALVLILTFDVWWRCHTIGPTVRDSLGFAPWPVVKGEAEPLDCDEAAYGYIGRKLAHGSVMYRDVSENKPPLGYWLYTLAVAIGGANETTIRLMPIPYVLATITLVWWLGLRLRGPGAACVAAFLYALLSTDPYLYGNGANMEHFINLFTVASLAAMVESFSRAAPVGVGSAIADLSSGLGSRRSAIADPTQENGNPSQPSRRWLVLAGVCVALATLVKQVAALHGLIYVLAVIFLDRVEPAGIPFSKRLGSKLADLAALAVGFASTLTLAVAVLWLQGAGPSAFEDIVTYGSALATIKVPDAHAPSKLVRWFTGNASPEGVLPPPFGLTKYLVWWGTGSWPLWLAAIPSTAWLLFARGAGGIRRLVAGWTLSSWVQVALPGLFWQHYYLLPTPSVALVVAVALADALRWVGESWRTSRMGGLLVGWVVGLVLFTSVVSTAVLQVRDYLLVAPEDLTSRFKGGYQWVVLRAMGREIARRSKAWDDRPSLYIWGIQSPLLLYSGLDSPTRHFFVDPLLEDYSRGYHRDDPRVRPRVERILRDLETHPPSMTVVAYPPFPELQKFLKARSIQTKLEVQRQTLPLWVDREHYARFAATAGSERPATAR
jgi:4-amino-4-deoxy-L-arabinose transferase-like glycosyltransferase